MKTLEKTMTEFVLEIEAVDDGYAYDIIYNYAEFLSTPLTLGMFVCVDEDGNVLEVPPIASYDLKDDSKDKAKELWDSYLQAKDRVLFEGFEVCNRNSRMDCLYNKEKDLHLTINERFYSMTLESLIPYKLKLTDNFKL